MDHDMPGMTGMPPPSTHPSGGAPPHAHDDMSYTHMTFFWGKNSEILFSGWPGSRTGMYVMALVLVFVLAVFVEALSACRGRKPSPSAGLVRTVVHGLRVGLAYLVMLAVMSFNGGVLITAVAGHVLGFLVFGSGLVIKRGDHDSDKGFDGC